MRGHGRGKASQASAWKILRCLEKHSSTLKWYQDSVKQVVALKEIFSFRPSPPTLFLCGTAQHYKVTIREACLRRIVLNCRLSEFEKFHSDLLLPSPLFSFAWLIVSQSSCTLQYKICSKYGRESLSKFCQSLY